MEQGPPTPPEGREGAMPRRSEERRVVTTLFCDLVGFTDLSERNDAELVDAFLRRYYAVARKAIEAYGGTVEKYIGDALVAVFGVLVLHEDDPERAVRAGLRLIDAIDALPGVAGQPVEVRVGINTGEVLVRLDVDPTSGEGFLTGDAVNVAARLQSAAPPMAVAVGEATHAATARVFSFEACHPVTLKGKVKPLQAWLAAAPLARTGSELRGFSSEFVGREEELAELAALLDRSIESRKPHLALLIGEPGIGKSRLLAEFARRLDDRPEVVTWRQGRCLPFGSNVTFWALSEIVRSQAGVLESDGVARTEARLEVILPDSPDRDRLRERLRPLLGLESPEASREENFAAWREFLEGLATDGPAVLVVEDLHWADEAMLAFMDDLATNLGEVPLLLLATARPQVLEVEGAGAAFVAAAEQVALGPLSGDETSRLILVRLGAKSLPVSLQAALLDRSGGNPLFVEELVRLLEDRDLLETRGGAVTLKPGTELPMPDSIGALIAARLDLLSPTHKSLLADAAVVGRTFWAGAVAAIGEQEPAPVLDGLMELVAKELVRPERGSSMEGEREFVFVHALVCDVAYDQLTRADRAAKHARLARWLEGRTAGRTEDLAEVLAYHYGTALEHANAAGLFDLEDELAEPTERYLTMAGGRAAPLDSAAAAKHFAKAERVADEAAKPKRRFFLSRRTRRTLRRRAPLLVAAAAVIVVALVVALAIVEFRPGHSASGSRTMSAAQIESAYGPSVVRITTPVLPASMAGTAKPARIVGSGFMVTRDGLIVTTPAVVEGHGGTLGSALVTVEYTTPTGVYGKTDGTVEGVDEGTGVALIKVDPRKVRLAPIPLGDSESLAIGQHVVALSAQREMDVSRAVGTITDLIRGHDVYSGNLMYVGIKDDVRFPATATGGPLMDAGGRAIGIVGPLGVGLAGTWGSYDLGWHQEAVTIKQAIGDITWFTKRGLANTSPGQAYLGVSWQWANHTVARAIGLGAPYGAMVTGVAIGSPAAKAGIRASDSDMLIGGTDYWTGGDVIVAVDGVPLRNEPQIGRMIRAHRPGDVVTLRIVRDGTTMSIRVRLTRLQ